MIKFVYSLFKITCEPFLPLSKRTLPISRNAHCFPLNKNFSKQIFIPQYEFLLLR